MFKLLGEGKVHAGDAGMNKLDLYYPILNIIREESKKYEYKPNTDQHIVVVDEDGCEFAENGGYPPTQNGDIRSLFWLFSLMALQN